MTATEVIMTLHNSGELQKLCRTVAPPRYSDDLVQEVLLALLEKPAPKILEMHTAGYLKWYVVRMTCNLYQSTTSPFHKKYRQFDYSIESTCTTTSFENLSDAKEAYQILAREKILANHTIKIEGGIDCDQTYDYEADQLEQQRIDRCNLAYEKLATGTEYPYEQKLLDLYLQVKNVSKMSRETGIPYRTLLHQLKAITQRIKDETDGIVNT